MSTTKAPQQRRAGDLAPDPEMWEALKDGDGLSEILREFYGLVYDDPKLNHFFVHTTKQRAIEKQFNFLYSIFAGEPVYFGERPYNAHAWMVISHELYDYREQIMAGCLRRYGLPEHLIHRWRSMEEVFRRHIVKTEARGRKIKGVELPVEGYDPIQMTVGGLCDGCEAEVEPGEMVRYHVRTGATYCSKCMPEDAVAPSV